jgi:diadenosine tetraphosphate (Ap4A) HIT family hydrolase
METPKDSPFHPIPADSLIAESDHALAFLDAYPVSEGHTLVIPKRIVPSLFDLPPDEQDAVWLLVATVRQILQKRFLPDGFNVGLNDGAAAGQTVPHAHVHLIPRYNGDTPDPRGGIRWIFPDKARYWG